MNGKLACNGITVLSGTFILSGVEIRNNQGRGVWVQGTAPTEYVISGCRIFSNGLGLDLVPFLLLPPPPSPSLPFPPLPSSHPLSLSLSLSLPLPLVGWNKLHCEWKRMQLQRQQQFLRRIHFHRHRQPRVLKKDEERRKGMRRGEERRGEERRGEERRGEERRGEERRGEERRGEERKGKERNRRG